MLLNELSLYLHSAFQPYRHLNNKDVHLDKAEDTLLLQHSKYQLISHILYLQATLVPYIEVYHIIFINKPALILD